jgi:S1-C subfamily serine protease
MSSTNANELSRFSEAFTALVAGTVGGVVAVKAAAYRVVSGVGLRDGLIAVADHSLRREDRVPVQASDGSQAVATILGRDPSIDVAVLRAEGLTVRPLQPVGASELKTGALIGIVGLTVDVGTTASLGILGALGGPRRTWRGGTLDAFLRLDVNTYPSQTGAAVVDTQGRLIGMATPGLLRHSPVAVPISTVDRVAQELLTQGRIRYGYLGVGMQPVGIPENLQSKLSRPQQHGVILLSVEPDSPAGVAGLQVGDILLSIGDQLITDVEELQGALRGDVIGKAVKVLVLRGGTPLYTDVTITERKKSKA